MKVFVSDSGKVHLFRKGSVNAFCGWRWKEKESVELKDVSPDEILGAVSCEKCHTWIKNILRQSGVQEVPKIDSSVLKKRRVKII